MNLAHRMLCNSNSWKQKLESDILPWVLDGISLGQEVLEVGPGPGLTTDHLRRRFGHITCLEIDPKLAAALEKRLQKTNVRVQCGSAAEIPFPDGSFTGALALTMLHHVPSAEVQDRVLEEVWRVLKPGGVFAGVDSLWSRKMAVLHLWDTMTLIDPSTMPQRLRAAGFSEVQVDKGDGRFRFRASKG